MQSVIDKLSFWINTVPKEFSYMTELEVSERTNPNKWSKKEIIGHLCDSAMNNLERFIKIQYEEQPFIITPYNQEQWVLLQDYENSSIEEVLNLWCSLNKQIIRVIEKIPSEKRSYLCDIGNKQIRTFEWLIEDYLEHMEHHLNNQVFVD
ncbi:metal-dependent hydrolase [Bacillus solimangrovi]|uniref:Metal-dependent hydrolase n=2 Tax=Bacillus solimangrovi TaxID=1305675 RepID=A0A1E5LEC7_9BACI|nr:metal-dependent hydrolase [Bacillus solimangrovi]